MTDDRARKKAVRRRMEQTGEKYTEARRALEGTPSESPEEGENRVPHSGMFDRFTEGARQVIVLAQDEARLLEHNQIRTEHILLGLLREEGGVAARVLGSFALSLKRVRAEVMRIVGTGEEVTGGIPFTTDTKNVIELALREAFSLGHNYIGTEHLLLGLVRAEEGVAARILLDFDVHPEVIRTELIGMLSGHGRRGRRLRPAGESGQAGESGGLFERFTERARQVVVLAQQEASELGHDHIDSEHILLGLLHEREGLAGRALETLGLTLEQARARVVQRVAVGEGSTRRERPFTPRAKRVLELALREALALGHNYIATEHILLGLVRDDGGISKSVLLDFAAGPERVRNEILRMLSLSPGHQLTAQDEVDLAKRIARGDDAAKQELVQSNMRLVLSIAEEYGGQGALLPDLINAGRSGLVRAAETFDYRAGFRFSSYATRWIRQAIVGELAGPSG